MMFYGSCLFAQVNDGDLEFSSFVQTLIRDSEGKPEKLAFHGQMSDAGGLTGGHLQAVPVSRSEVMTSADVKKILSAQENRAGESGGMFSVPESSLVSGGADFLFQSQNVPDNQGNLSPGRMEDSVDLNNGVGQLVLESLDENAAVFLSVDDITSFSDSGDSLEQESNRKDVSWEQETESTIILSGPPENAEDTEFSEIIAVCQENLEESLTLFREYPPMTSWVQETERLVLEILENMENNSGKSRQALTALKNHLTLLDGFKSRLIQEDKQKKPSYVTASIGFGLNTGEKKDGSLFNGVVVRDVKNGDNEPEISSWSRDGQNGSAGSLLETGVAQSSCIKQASSFPIRSVNVEVPVMTISDSSESRENDSAESGLPALIARYNLASRLELVDVLRIALDRRIYLWSLAVDYYEAKRNGILVPHHEFTTGELLLLQRQTEEVRNFFGISATGQGWRDVFEVDLLYADIERILKRMKQGDVAFRPVSVNTEEDNGEVFSGSDLKHEWECLNGRINTICYKVSVTPMTVDQKKVFVREPMIGWVQTLQCFTSDRLVGNDLLREFEIYERTGGGMTGVRLYQDGMQLKHSPSPVCRKFGEAIEIIYDNPNLKVYISEMLINRLLPIRDPEFDVVQETVLNNPVAGRRRTDTQVFIKLVPDPERLLMKLNIDGEVIATTSSTVFPATVYNESYATYFGQKQIEWKNNGIVYSPVELMVRNNNQLSGVQTDVDFVPLIGDLTREVVKGQYESRQSAIRKETKNKIAQEAKRRIDREADERFDLANQRLNENFFAILNRLGLSMKMQKSKTTQEWLLASLRLSGSGTLGCQSPEPPTLPGAFADFKLHESTVNVALAQLQLEGQEFTIQELLNHLSERLNRPQLKDREIESPVDLIIGMSEVDPVTIRFYEDRIQLRLAFEFIQLDNQEWDDIEVTVSYRPIMDTQGNAMLVRDGRIELEGPLCFRAQMTLRTMFSKIFPAQERFSMTPKLFKEDERFTGLSIGLCRVTRGWFSCSVICP